MIQRRFWTATSAALVGITLPGLSLAATLNVPGDFATIQACIDAAVSGVDECVVAPGTYHETINFLGKAITLRSSGGADVTTIDATGLGGSVVTCASGEGSYTVLDGFTITGGTSSGMYNDGSSPTVTNCIFSGNAATNSGGGMYNLFGSPRVTDCKFTGNTAGNYGGGMSNDSGSPTVTNCTFSGNTSEYNGGGMDNAYGSPTVTNCKFIANRTYQGGAGMSNFDSNAIVTNCTFSRNASVVGGGMDNALSSPTVTNCAFSGNTADYDGGGMLNDSGSPTVTNCTFTGNTANESGGAMYNDYAGNPVLNNCILRGDIPEEIVNIDESAVPTIRFSDVQGGLPVGAVDGGGNFDLDPMFVRTPDPGPDGTWDGVDDDYGDLRLRAGSPCFDAGDQDFVAQPGETDLEGHARVLCEYVDMGAYEFGIGNYDCNQTIDLTDFASWSSCMTGPLQSAIGNWQLAISCEAFDFDGDGDVDLFDFAAFQRILTAP